MCRRILTWLIPIVLICTFIWAAFALPEYMVSVHQRGVTQELAKWNTEYSSIESHYDAVRTAEMLGYVQRYYVPGEGYRGTPRIEDALQLQRQDTIDSLVASLRDFTGEDYGTDSDKWLTFLKSFKADNDLPEDR